MITDRKLSVASGGQQRDIYVSGLMFQVKVVSSAKSSPDRVSFFFLDFFSLFFFRENDHEERIVSEMWIT